LQTLRYQTIQVLIVIGKDVEDSRVVHDREVYASLLWYCVNERINYLAQPFHDSLALMDEIIDNAILRAGGLPLAPPDSLSYLTTFTLCSLPCDLGGLRIILVVLRVKRLRGRSVLYEFAEKYTPRLLEGATLDF
jgi:hypothetical protein